MTNLDHLEAPNGGMHDSIFVKVWGDAGGGDAGRRALAQYAFDLARRAAPVSAPIAGDARARVERENTEFTEWWASSGQGADPAHTLITENACHAAWQERARRAALANQPAPTGDAEEAAKLQTLLASEFDCYRVSGRGLMAWATNALLDNSPHRNQPAPTVPVPAGDARERFEHWMANVAKCIVGSSDPYPAGLEHDRWTVWQAALAHQPAQEQASKHVGWFLYEHNCWVATSSDDPRGVKLYRSPPAQEQAEPVAWMDPKAGCAMDAFLWQPHPGYNVPVYTRAVESRYRAASPVVRAQSEESEVMSPVESATLIAKYEGIRQVHAGSDEKGGTE